jgi:hypothetical protein
LTSCSQLRYLQTLTSISAENNSTIIFPVPIDIISSLMGQVTGPDGRDPPQEHRGSKAGGGRALLGVNS